MTALLTATALVAACGDGDSADEDGGISGGGGTAASGTGGNGTGAIVIGGGGDDGSGGDSNVGGAPCGESPFESDPVLVNILLVIDKSGSMEAALGASTRWAAMGSAINSAVSATMDSISYGLLLYPSDASCGVPSAPDVAVQVGTDAAAEISAAIDDATPSGATPTASALAAAAEYFESGPGADLEGLKYVLLATDGGPNCPASDDVCMSDQCTWNIEHAFNPDAYPLCDDTLNCCESDTTQCLDDADTLAAITALEGAGVKTIVVGIPGTEAYADLLDQMAVEGGSPNPDAPPSYYAVEDGDVTGLADVLQSITTGLIRECEFQLASVPPDDGLVNVYVDDVKIPYDADGEEGWMYLEPETDPPTIVLVGAVCDQALEQGLESVRVTFGCPMVVK